MDTLTLSLVITLIGMGLVFSAIMLLWGVMALLVRFTRDPIQKEIPEEPDEEALKLQAASVAVSLALTQLASTEPHEFPLPPTALVSAWQAVTRTKVLNKRGPVR